jgi:hypothetical protein
MWSARRGAEHAGDPAQQRRVALEQRQRLHAGGQRGQEPVEPGENLVGVARLGQPRQDRGQHRVQGLARAGRAQRADTARVPAAHGRDHLVGGVVAPSAQRRDGVRRGLPVAAEIERPRRLPPRRQRGHQLERPRVARPHAAEMAEQPAREGVGVRIAEENRDPRQLRRLLGHVVGLPISDHLKAVLDLAEVGVGRRQLGLGVRRDLARSGEQAERLDRGADAQGRIAAAPDELQGLDQELDLADTAFAQLDVVPGDPRRRVRRVRQRAAPVRVDAPLHRVDIGDGGEIEARAPDEGADRVQERLPQGAVARHRARLDHRRALPVLAHRLVIGDRPPDGDRGRGGRGVGAQAEVGAEHVAVGVARLYRTRDAGS